jgi:hypothetical protein
MIGSFAVAFRGFLASLLSGAMALFAIYVFFGEGLVASLEPAPHVRWLLEYSRYVPVGSLLLVSLLAGSLYTTALEGIIDTLQRKHLAPAPDGCQDAPSRIAPLSESAQKRLQAEAALFFDIHCPASRVPEISKASFVQAVMADILWMDGKLVGTPLLTQFNSIRAEGEIKVSSSLLLPFTVAALARAASLGDSSVIVVALVSLPIALKLLDYGLYYYRRANSLIAHHVADGAVLTPTMESLKRRNLATRTKAIAATAPVEGVAAPRDDFDVETPDDILDRTEGT